VRIEKLEAQLAVLRRDREHRRPSQKLERDIERLELLIGNLEEDQAESQERIDATKRAASASARRPQLQPVRTPLPDHLPRERVEHPAADRRNG
jgi:transposase